MRDTDRERRRRFDALFRAYSAGILAYCGWRLQSESDAQDAMAEAFLTVWRRLDDVPEGEGARAWVYAVARRVMANQRRSQRRRVVLQEELARQAERSAAPSLDSAPSADGAAHEAVHAALARLKPVDREVLLLAEWEGLTSSEIATVMGCLTVTARGRLHRARLRFRDTYRTVASGEAAPTDVEATDVDAARGTVCGSRAALGASRLAGSAARSGD